MASSFTAYYAENLPAPLPTIADIHESNEVFSPQPARMVVGVGEHFVVKYGRGIDLIEGETLLYLEHTAVPAPQLYAMFRDESTKKNYIIMERIKGRTLEDAYPTLDNAAKEVIATRLRSVLDHMRTLPSPDPDGYPYCSVGRSGLPDGIFWTNDPTTPFAGPFKTEHELNEGMIAKYQKECLSKDRGDFYWRVFQQVFRDHPPVFTHGNLQRKNIILRDNGDKEPDVVLIDFEYSRWYPTYWEYSRAIFACGRWKDDWNVWVGKVLEPAYVEYAWTELLLRDLWT